MFMVFFLTFSLGVARQLQLMVQSRAMLVSLFGTVGRWPARISYRTGARALNKLCGGPSCTVQCNLVAGSPHHAAISTVAPCFAGAGCPSIPPAPHRPEHAPNRRHYRIRRWSPVLQTSYVIGGSCTRAPPPLHPSPRLFLLHSSSLSEPIVLSSTLLFPRSFTV